MKQPKRILVLSPSEYRLMLHGLIHFRNKLIQQGKYTDAVDELLIKLQKAFVDGLKYGAFLMRKLFGSI